jgi:hypothetical protein
MYLENDFDDFAAVWKKSLKVHVACPPMQSANLKKTKKQNIQGPHRLFTNEVR